MYMYNCIRSYVFALRMPPRMLTLAILRTLHEALINSCYITSQKYLSSTTHTYHAQDYYAGIIGWCLAILYQLLKLASKSSKYSV